MRINPDSTFVHILVNIFDAALTAFYFVICSLPIFTFGAAATAMHSVMMSIANGGVTGVTGTFFRVFRENFKLATGVWGLGALAGAVVGADVFVCYGFVLEPGPVLAVMQGLTIGCSLLYFSLMAYVFAGISKYQVTWKQAIRNALFWTMKKPLHTIALLLINALTVLGCYLAWIYAFPVLVGMLFLQAMVLNSAFGIKRLPKVNPIGGEDEVYYE